jgi:TetR/AcrR family transcriptional regulator
MMTGGSGGEAAAPAVSRQQQRKARTSGSIIEAARDRFLQQGYHRTTVEEIAADAEVSVGSIYVHFGSKEGIYAALLQQAMEIEKTYTWPALEGPFPLIATGQAYLRFYAEQPGAFRVLNFPLDGVGAPDAESTRRLRQRAEERIEMVAAVIRRRVELGVLRPMDARRAAEFLWGAWSGTIALSARVDPLHIDAEEMHRVLAEGERLLAEGILTNAMRHADGSADAVRVAAADVDSSDLAARLAAEPPGLPEA